MDTCTSKNTSTTILIKGPLPNVLTLNLNYQNLNSMAPSELLKIYTSLSDTFPIDDLFLTENKRQGYYQNSE